MVSNTLNYYIFNFLLKSIQLLGISYGAKPGNTDQHIASCGGVNGSSRLMMSQAALMQQRRQCHLCVQHQRQAHLRLHSVEVDLHLRCWRLCWR